MSLADRIELGDISMLDISIEVRELETKLADLTAQLDAAVQLARDLNSPTNKPIEELLEQRRNRNNGQGARLRLRIRQETLSRVRLVELGRGSEVMKDDMTDELKQRFIDALLAAGWRSPLDAQWRNIDAVIAEFVSTRAPAESEPPNIQAHVDAALESVDDQVRALDISKYSTCQELFGDILDILEEYDGSNPLAEAQTEIAQLREELATAKNLCQAAEDTALGIERELIKALTQKPTDTDIIKTLSAHYGVTHGVVVQWIMAMDLTGRSAK